MRRSNLRPVLVVEPALNPKQSLRKFLRHAVSSICPQNRHKPVLVENGSSHGNEQLTTLTRRHTYLLVGFVFSTALSILFLSNFLFKPGLVEWFDIDYSYYLETVRKGFSAWDSRISNPTIYILYSFNFWIWILPFAASGEAFEKSLYLVAFFLTVFLMFVVTYRVSSRWARGNSLYVFSFTSSFLYLVNPYVIQIAGGGPTYVLFYATVPLTFCMTKLASNLQLRDQKVITFFLILGILEAISFVTAFSFLLSFCFIVFTSAYWVLIQSGINLNRKIRRLLLIWLSTAVISVLLEAYVILPWLYFRETYSKGFMSSEILGSVPIMDALRITPDFFNVEWGLDYIGLSSSAFWQSLRESASFVVPLIAFASVFHISVRKIGGELFTVFDRVYTIVLLNFIAVLSVLLSTGIEGPLAPLYSLVVNNLPYGWLLHYPAFFQGFTAFSYSLLCGYIAFLVSNASAIKRISIGKIHFRPRIISIIIILFLASSIVAAPFYTGDLGGMLRPAQIPESYIELNSWLISQEGWFRTAWLPEYGGVAWMPTSHPVLAFATPLPVASSYITYQNEFMSFALQEAPMIDNLTMGNMMGLFSVRYVIFHNDTSSDESLFGILSNQENMHYVKKIGDLYIFENEAFQPRIRALSKVLLYYGPRYNIYGLKNLSMPLQDYAVISAEEATYRNLFANFSSSIILYDGSASADFTSNEDVLNSSVIYLVSNPSSFKVRSARTYILAVFAPLIREAHAQIDSQKTVVHSKDNSGWLYSDPMPLSSGLHNIEFRSLPNSTMVALFSADSQKYTLKELFEESATAELDYQEISPSKYTVRINSSVPFVLAFSESFDQLWEANIDGTVYAGARLYYQINGFLINRTGSLTATISYKPQNDLEIGSVVSILTLSTIVGYLSLQLVLRLRNMNRKRIKYR